MKRLAFLAVVVLAAAAIALPVTIAGGATSVSVTGKDYKFILSKKTVRHGTVTFKFHNAGKRTHDFKIAGKATKTIVKGKSAAPLTVKLKKGSYRYICTIPGHVDKGMKGTLRVT
jgi:plastocyanin